MFILYLQHQTSNDVKSIFIWFIRELPLSTGARPFLNFLSRLHTISEHLLLLPER